MGEENPKALNEQFQKIDLLSIQVINDHIKNLKKIKQKINSICLYIVEIYNENLFQQFNSIR